MIGNYRRVSLEELSRLRENPESISDFLYSETEQAPPAGRRLDIDKTWHAIHFLLTGSSWEGSYPLVCVVMGGESIGTQDVGYGPARFLTPAEVKDVANSLDEISVSDLLERYDPDALNAEEIYPQGWSDAEEERKYIGQYYSQLTEFFRKAAHADDAMLVYLN